MGHNITTKQSANFSQHWLGIGGTMIVAFYLMSRFGARDSPRVRVTRARKEGRMNDHHRCRTIHLALGHERGVRRVVEDLGRKPLPIYRVPSTQLDLASVRVRPRPSPPPSLSFPPSQRLMKGRMANGGEFSTQSQVREHLPPLDIFQSIVERLCVCTAARNCVSE